MTDLTEQWQKGELPEGDYFITDGDEIYPDYFDSAEGFLKTYNYGVQQVIAPVPSYEKWQLMQDDNKRLKHDVGNLGYKIKNQRKEIERQIAQNTRLKELLKQAIESVYVERANDNSLGDTIWNYTTKLINEINQALGEN